MLLRKAFKFEIMPNGEQSRKIKQFCGCCRFVFNRALAWQNEQYQQDNNQKFSYSKIANLLPQWKKELIWLKECHSQVLQQSLKDLENAFKNELLAQVIHQTISRQTAPLRELLVARALSSTLVDTADESAGPEQPMTPADQAQLDAIAKDWFDHEA